MGGYMLRLQIQGRELRQGQRVVVVTNSMLYDTGRVSRLGYGDGGSTENPQIVISSDGKKGKEVTLGFFHEEECWRFLMEAFLSGGLCYSYNTRFTRYQIEGLD